MLLSMSWPPWLMMRWVQPAGNKMLMHGFQRLQHGCVRHWVLIEYVGSWWLYLCV